MPAAPTLRAAAAAEVKVLRDTWSGAKDCSFADSSAVEKIAVGRACVVRGMEVAVKASQDRTPAAVARSARVDFIVAIPIQKFVTLQGNFILETIPLTLKRGQLQADDRTGRGGEQQGQWRIWVPVDTVVIIC